MSYQWKVICNPKSANGKASRDWPLLKSLLHEQQIEFDCDFSNYKYHAIDLSRQAFEHGFRHFIIIGGDGSFHEVVNGIAGLGMDALDQSRFALIPVGKGNDWARTFHIPKKYREAIRIISSSNTMPQDLGMVTFKDPSGFSASRFFINMTGIGFDAYVARAIGKRFERGSRLSTISYAWQLVRSLFTYRSKPASVSLNGMSISTRLFTLAAGIGRYNGGGMKQCPSALPDDGLLDITIVDHVSVPTVLLNIHRLFNGRFVTLRQVSQYQTSDMSISADRPLLIEADGEVLGKTPASITISQKKLHIVIP